MLSMRRVSHFPATRRQPAVVQYIVTNTELPLDGGGVQTKKKRAADIVDDRHLAIKLFKLTLDSNFSLDCLYSFFSFSTFSSRALRASSSSCKDANF
jgi:hypothetical protein